MEDRFARVISFMFHPLLMPLYILLLLFCSDLAVSDLLPFSAKLVLAGIICFITILVPLGLIGMLYRLKMISSLYMEKREDRIYPLLITGVFYYLAYYLLKGIHTPVLSIFMLGSTLLVVSAMVITFYRKISLHMIGMGGLSGVMMGLSHQVQVPWLLFIILLVAGITGSARLKISAHKSSEIYSGFLLGAFVMFILFSLV